MSEKSSSGLTLVKLKDKKMVPVYLGVLFLAALIGVFLLLLGRSETDQKQNKGAVVFRIEGKDFYESDVSALIRYPTEEGGFSKEYSQQLAFENLKIISAAEQLNIKLDSKLIDSRYQSYAPQDILKDPSKSEKYGGWFRMLATVELINTIVGGADKVGLNGYAFVFYFGQHIEYGDDYKPDGLNDPGLIAQDQAYAKERAEFYHAKLKAKELTDDQIIQEIKNDPKLKTFVEIKNPFGRTNPSMWKEDLYYQSIINFLNGSSANGISDIQVGGNIPGPTMGNGEEPVDLYYYFVNVESNSDIRIASKSQLEEKVSKIDAEYLTKYDPEAYPITAKNIDSRQETQNDTSGEPSR